MPTFIIGDLTPDDNNRNDKGNRKHPTEDEIRNATQRWRHKYRLTPYAWSRFLENSKLQMCRFCGISVSDEFTIEMVMDMEREEPAGFKEAMKLARRLGGLPEGDAV